MTPGEARGRHATRGEHLGCVWWPTAAMAAALVAGWAARDAESLADTILRLLVRIAVVLGLGA